MTKLSNQKIWLLTLIAGILVFAAFIRLFKLAEYPPQLNRDEAALAINALYIKQAGVDEWGQRFPIQFKSLGDYKLPGYIYLLSAVFQFRIDDFAVRLPAAVSGIAIVIVSTVWLNSLLKKKLSKPTLVFFLGSIAIAPFAIFYSRMAWEANLALALMISALTLLHSQNFSWKKDLIAAILFLLASVTYNSPFLLLPFFIITLPILRGIRSYKKWLLPVISLSIVFVGVAALFSQNNAQKTGILFFTDPDVVAQYPTYRETLPSILKPILGSRYAFFAVTAFNHYKDTFLPKFLVISGGQHPWHSILGRGHLYWTIYCLFVVGLISQLGKVLLILTEVKKKKLNALRGKLQNFVPLFFLLVSPLPAIFTTDAPHATRSLFTFVMIIVFAAIGFEFIYNQIKNKHKYISATFLTIVSFLLILESSNYISQYFIVWPESFSPDFQLGFLPVLHQVTDEHPQGDISIIDLGWYMYVIVAWYEKIPSAEFLRTVERSGPDLVGLYRVKQVGRYYFVYHDDEPVPNKTGLITRDQYDGHWKL